MLGLDSRRTWKPFIVAWLVAVVLALSVGSARATPQGPAPPEGYVDRSGLSELVAWQGVNGLFAGMFLSTALFAGAVSDNCDFGAGEESNACKDARTRAAGVVALGLAAGVATPLLVTRGRPVRTVDSIIINRSTLIGAMHGYILPFAAGLEPFEPGRSNYALEVDQVRTLAGMTFAGDVLGVLAGSYLANRYENVTPGTASFLGTIHSATFFAAMSVGTSFPDHASQDDMRLITGTSLALADIALGLGLYYVDRIDIGRNRVFWLDTGALLGWLAGAALGTVFAGDDQRAGSIGGSVGMAAGIVLTYWQTKEEEPWRRRYSPDTAFRLEAPSLSISPVRNGERTGTAVSVQALRGTF
jgi:hypothetical protein